MNPEEKAKDLIYRYSDVKIHGYSLYKFDNCVKQCALIAVQEILNCNPHTNSFNTDVYSTYDYWFKVKLEIEKL